MADEALRTLNRHTWYLSEELVLMALFSGQTPKEIKEEMRMKLQLCAGETSTKRIGLESGGFGKPFLPSLPEKDTSPASLIGVDSWRYFSITGIKCDFLHLEVDEWDENAEYLRGKIITNNLEVVNEAAERGVKLCYDFLHVSKDEKRLQDVLQVVEEARKIDPNQRKLSSRTREKAWFLAQDTD